MELHGNPYMALSWNVAAMPCACRIIAAGYRGIAIDRFAVQGIAMGLFRAKAMGQYHANAMVYFMARH